MNITENNHQSPDYLRTSLAAAMTLGFKPGLFYRNAKLYCINLLLTYQNGCSARCAYCGLSGKRPGDYDKKSFIRVDWPSYPLDDIIRRINERPSRVKRVCLSMITRPRAVEDSKEICARLKAKTDVPISVLLAPTILESKDLSEFKAIGVDKVGVAIDLATPGLFDKYRGSGVGGPHDWERYWQCLKDALQIFGKGNAGPHFMVGMGESERDMCRAIQRAHDLGGFTHLFSFFPERDSALADHPMPLMEHYRRVQLARYLIDADRSSEAQFTYDSGGRITAYGLEEETLQAVIDTGEAFRTSGCTGRDGVVACNRPYANSRPGKNIRNFPFAPDESDIARIHKQMNRPARSET